MESKKQSELVLERGKGGAGIEICLAAKLAFEILDSI